MGCASHYYDRTFGWWIVGTIGIYHDPYHFAGVCLTVHIGRVVQISCKCMSGFCIHGDGAASRFVLGRGIKAQTVAQTCEPSVKSAVMYGRIFVRFLCFASILFSKPGNTVGGALSQRAEPGETRGLCASHGCLA